MGRTSTALLIAVAVGFLATACGAGSGSTNGTSKAGISGPAVAGPATGPAPTGYAPWPEAEHDAAHSSQAGVRGPQTGHIRWQAELGSPVNAGPSIGADGTIYVATDAGILYALNPVSGHKLWSFDGDGSVGGDDLSTTAAILPDGTIVWPGPRHTVFGIDPDGRLQWAVNVGAVPLSPVIESPTAVYVMTTAGVLAALKIDGSRTGERWALKLGHQSLGSPAIRRDGVIETTVDDCLVAVRDNGGTARELWQFTVPQQVEVSAAVAPNGTAVLGTNDGFEYGVSAAGRQLWKRAVSGPSFSSSAITSTGRAYYGDNSGILTVSAATTGASIRMLAAQPGITTPEVNIWTAPLIDSAGDVYYGTKGGEIYGYSPGGTQLFAVRTGRTVDSYPAMSAAGDLLVGSDNGSLYSIGP